MHVEAEAFVALTAERLGPFESVLDSPAPGMGLHGPLLPGAGRHIGGEPWIE